MRKENDMTIRQENAIIGRMVDKVTNKTGASVVQVKTLNAHTVALIATRYDKADAVTYIGDLSARTLKKGA